MQNDPLAFDIKDFLEASSDASGRTRATLIAMVIASVVSFASVLHAMSSRWMHERILAAADIKSDYVGREIGRYPIQGNLTDDEYAKQVDLYEHRYLAFCEGLEKTDVENFIVSVPFIGFTFDVNDLDIVGAFGFLAILTLYRFFLAREFENLQLSFREAKSLGLPELQKFYTLLSMRQVFTVPRTALKAPSRFRRVTPKLVIWLPAVILSIVEVDDLSTFSIGSAESDIHALVAVACGTLGFLFSVALSVKVTSVLIQMDKVWQVTWEELQAWNQKLAQQQTMRLVSVIGDGDPSNGDAGLVETGTR